MPRSRLHIVFSFLVSLFLLNSACANEVTIESPFAAGSYEIVNGSTSASVTGSLVTGGDPFHLNALRVTVADNHAGSSFWVKVDEPLDSALTKVYYWSYSRGTPWIAAYVVLQNPDGVIGTYTPHSFGDSPWGHTGIALELNTQTPTPPVQVLETLPQGDGEWHFRGWWYNYGAYQNGTFTLGSLEFPSVNAGPPTGMWMLKDVDESIRFQGAYTGFNMSYDGETFPMSIPQGLLVDAPHAQGQKLSWELLTVDGQLVAKGETSISSPSISSSIELASVPAGSYWWNWQVHDASGALLSNNQASIIVSASEETTLPSISGNSLHAIYPSSMMGELPIDVSNPVSIWFPVTVAPASQIPATATLDIALYDGYGIFLGQVSGMKIKTAPGGQTVYAWAPRTPFKRGMRYELECKLYDGSKLLDERMLYLLVGPEPALAEDLDTSGPYALSHKLGVSEVGAISISQPELRSAQLDHMASYSTKSIPALSLNWDEIEPSEGFFQWNIVDDMLVYAIDRGLKPVPTLYFSLDHLPRWLWYEQVLDQQLQNNHYAATYVRKAAPTAQRTLNALETAITAIVTRYKDVPEISGWNFSQGVESFWSDASRKERVVDYSQATSLAFGQYLIDEGWTLPEISSALGITITSVNDIVPPQPDFSGELDLRPIWLAWQNFKQQYPAIYFETIFSAVRAVDPSRPLHQYAGMGAGDLSYYLPVFQSYDVELAFGAGGSTVAPSLQSIALQFGVPMQAEPSGVPPTHPDIAVTTFYKLAHGMSSGDINIMWGRYFDSGNSETISGIEAATELLDSLPDVESLPVNCDIAIGLGMRSIINQSRSFMWIDWVNFNTYGYGSVLTSVIAGNANAGFVTEHFPQDLLDAWQAIVWLEAPLLANEDAERIANHIANGGKAILMGETGRYDETGAETWYLRDILLGSDPNAAGPQAYGNGQFVWRETPITWGTWNARMSNEFAWMTPERVINSSSTSVRVGLRKVVGEEQYLAFALGKNWTGGTPAYSQLNHDPLPFTFSLPGLPAGKIWTVESLDPAEGILGNCTSAQLSSGLDLSVNPAEIKAWKITQSTP